MCSGPLGYGVLQGEFPDGFQGPVAANFLGLLSLLGEKAGAGPTRPEPFSWGKGPRRGDSRCGCASPDSPGHLIGLAALHERRNRISPNGDALAVSTLIPIRPEQYWSGNHFARVITSQLCGPGKGGIIPSTAGGSCVRGVGCRV